MKKIIFISFFVFVLCIAVASATKYCELNTWQRAGYDRCTYFDKGACSADDRYYCTAGNFFMLEKCESGTFYNDYLKKWVFGEETCLKYYYCDLNGNYVAASFMNCPNGCKNGVCQSQYCQPSTEWCENNNVYHCNSDGMTFYRKSTCGVNPCIEESASTARCKTETGYCINQNGLCQLCSSKDHYDTEADCKKNREFACYNPISKICVKRKGACLNGETGKSGTGLDEQMKEWCGGESCVCSWGTFMCRDWCNSKFWFQDNFVPWVIISIILVILIAKISPALFSGFKIVILVLCFILGWWLLKVYQGTTIHTAIYGVWNLLKHFFR